MRLIKSLIVGTAAAIALLGCRAEGDYPGREYAPNMYHAVPYEPLKQITDEDAGRWVTSIDYPDNHAEYYNSNKFNPHAMNMREPAPNTIKRSTTGYLPPRIHKDSLVQAARTLVNPLDSTAAVLAEGKALYQMYCQHCHGAKGEGDGAVAEKYAGVPNYKSDALINMSEGHIYHVITYGKGLMWPHASQVTPEERWRIAKYVKALQR